MRRVERRRVSIVLLVGVAVFTGCGGAESSNAEEPEGEGRAAKAAGASCIATYAENPCDLLTEALVREHVPGAPAAIERTDVGERLASLGVSSRAPGGIAQNGCRYGWEGGRTRSLQSPLGKSAETESEKAMADALRSLTQNLPIDDTVAFTSIQAVEAEDPVARFERKWSAPTEADRELLAERMDEKMEETSREGKVSESGAELGRGMGRSLSRASISYEAVEGVGTRARWGGLGSERELRVLDGDTEFAVAVDVSDDEATNHELAVALARDLLARCDG